MYEQRNTSVPRKHHADYRDKGNLTGVQLKPEHTLSGILLYGKCDSLGISEHQLLVPRLRLLCDECILLLVKVIT